MNEPKQKAEWRNRDFKANPHPPREDFSTWDELALPNGEVIAQIQAFTSYPEIFYATTPGDRSGAVRSYDRAREWCEAKSGNRPN